MSPHCPGPADCPVPLGEAAAFTLDTKMIKCVVESNLAAVGDIMGRVLSWIADALQSSLNLISQLGVKIATPITSSLSSGQSAITQMATAAVGSIAGAAMATPARLGSGGPIGTNVSCGQYRWNVVQDFVAGTVTVPYIQASCIGFDSQAQRCLGSWDNFVDATLWLSGLPTGVTAAPPQPSQPPPFQPLVACDPGNINTLRQFMDTLNVPQPKPSEVGLVPCSIRYSVNSDNCSIDAWDATKTNDLTLPVPLGAYFDVASGIDYRLTQLEKFLGPPWKRMLHDLPTTCGSFPVQTCPDGSPVPASGVCPPVTGGGGTGPCDVTVNVPPCPTVTLPDCINIDLCHWDMLCKTLKDCLKQAVAGGDCALDNDTAYLYKDCDGTYGTAVSDWLGEADAGVTASKSLQQLMDVVGHTADIIDLSGFAEPVPY